MLEQDVHTLIQDLMIEHGIAQDGWSYRFNNNHTRAGVCYYSRKHIELSRNFFESDDHVIRNTILHEIAHALVGPSHGHGPVWKAKATEIGCTGTRCAEGAVYSGTSRYVGRCTNGGCTDIPKHRLTSSLFRCAKHDVRIVWLDTKTDIYYHNKNNPVLPEIVSSYLKVDAHV